jgi:type I restriction enzyme R subunit
MMMKGGRRNSVSSYAATCVSTSFIAQVMKLEDTSLEKLYSYGAWLARLLPNREIPPEVEITDDMLRLQRFKIVQKEEGEASLAPGDTAALSAISEFGAKPYHGG